MQEISGLLVFVFFFFFFSDFRYSTSIPWSKPRNKRITSHRIQHRIASVFELSYLMDTRRSWNVYFVVCLYTTTYFSFRRTPLLNMDIHAQSHPRKPPVMDVFSEVERS
jgi:hypothetical protein